MTGPQTGPQTEPGHGVLAVERAGPLTTVQDLGRPGFAALGVPRSGAADRGSLRLANRLVGNRETVAGLEVTLGGLVLRPSVDVVIAVTGAQVGVRIGGRPAGCNAVLRVPAGAAIELGAATAGVRGYLAVRGGLAVTPVLGSRSTDTLSGLGPPRLVDGARLPFGDPDEDDVVGWPLVDLAAIPLPAWAGSGPVRLEALPGPRADWFTAPSLRRLWTAVWTVTPQSDRIGVRLVGSERLERLADGELARLPGGPVDGELPSEPLVRGAVQVPPSGLPLIFLADHPVTGGYPVVAVLRERSVDLAAQLVAGQQVRIVAPRGS